jgi:hypothetical protein
VPDAAVVAVWRWVQNVSPLGAKNWSTIVWPEAGVWVTARSQSSPTPQTQLPALVVVRETEGAPVVALAVAVAPLVAVSAPVKAATVIEPW